MNDDFGDCLAALDKAGVRFLVVGAHAMAVHGVPRATGDLDIWIEADETNAARVLRALLEFGAPINSLDLTVEDFAKPGNVIQIGLPPRRIDLLTRISGVDFDNAWRNRLVQYVDGRPTPFLGREDLLSNKKAVGRPQDIADVALLEAQAGTEEPNP